MLAQPTIVVCTDFSENSDLALKYAEELRKKSHGRIHVVHFSEFPLDWDWIHDEADGYYMDDKLKAVIEKDISKKLNNQLLRCEVLGTSQFVSGYPFTYINQIIKNEKANLVVLGHKGRMKTPLALGGLAEKLISTAEVPLLVIKKNMPLEKITGLIDPNFPMDKMINACEEFASLFSAKLGILALWKDVTDLNPDLSRMGVHYVDQNISPEQKKELLHKIKVIIRSHVTRQLDCEIKVELSTEKRVAYQLMNILHEDETDMIVLQRHHKKLFERLFIGSESRRMLELFQGNLLILPI